MNGYTFGRMDSLEYSYRDKATGDMTNRLQRVDEYANTAYGYKGSGDGYEYDGNGNIIRDHNKGVTIVYNHLNLPKLFTFDAGGTITITYDAAGIKLKKEVKIQGGDNYTLHYIAGIEYREETSIEIESIHHAEGRVTYDENDTLQYEYHLKDHLGNVRIVFADKDGDGYIEPFNVNPNKYNSGITDEGWDLTDTEILQESHYYPFGMAMDGAWQDIVNGSENKYLYNGKELNSDFGLDWSDYGARYYDASIGRWNSIDPLAEIIPNYSPYAYAFNNPIAFNDPTGMMGESPFDQHMNSRSDWKDDNGQNSGKIDVEMNNYIGREAGDDPPNCCPNWRGAAKAAYNVTRDNIKAATYGFGAVSSFFGPPLVDYLMPPLEATPQEANTYYATIIILAIIDPSPAGEMQAGSKMLSARARTLQKKFKHAIDFGVTENWNSNAAEVFSSAISNHVKSSGVKAIEGTYRGNPVIHYVNPESGVNAMFNSAGEFISGWKLAPEQLKNVLERGSL